MDKERHLLNLLAELTAKVEDLEEKNRKLEKLAYEDALTGLRNRAYYKEWTESLTISDYPLNIISVDCNGLKKINDTYGHNYGDEYIITSAQILKKIFPEDAVICRTGGDEFVIAMRGSSEDTNSLIASVQELASRMSLSNGEPVSLSIGSAHAERYIKRIDNLFEEADKKMYEQKREYHKVKSLVAC